MKATNNIMIPSAEVYPDRALSGIHGYINAKETNYRQSCNADSHEWREKVAVSASVGH